MQGMSQSGRLKAISQQTWLNIAVTEIVEFDGFTIEREITGALHAVRGADRTTPFFQKRVTARRGRQRMISPWESDWEQVLFVQAPQHDGGFVEIPYPAKAFRSAKEKGEPNEE